MHLLAKMRQKTVVKMKKGVANRQRQSLRSSGMNLTITTEILGEHSTQQVQVTSLVLCAEIKSPAWLCNFRYFIFGS